MKSVEAIILHHLHSFADNDLESVLSDYTEESVLITQTATYTGPEKIRSFFTGLMKHFPLQHSDFTLDKLVTDNEMAYIVWHASTPSLEVSMGTDTFFIKEGKIHQQTFAGEMKFLQG